MRLIYLHFDKCGGTTVQNLLRNQFAEHEACFIERAPLSPSVREPALPPAYLRNFRFFHDPYGALRYHELINGCYYFAIFREPLQRLHSNWAMITRWSDGDIKGQRGLKKVRKIARRGFKAYLESDHPFIAFHRWNWYARSLFLDHHWLQAQKTPWPRLENEVFATARRHLSLFRCVGLLENLEDALARLARDFRLAPQPAQMQRYNTHRPDTAELSDPGIIKSAARWLELDYALYDQAKAMAAEQRQRYRDAPDDDAPFLSVTPPDHVLFRFDQALPGNGFHAREINGDKKSAWSGPGNDAQLHFPLSADADMRLAITITNFIEKRQLESLRVSVNGVPLAGRLAKETTPNWLFTAPVPRTALAREAGWARLALSISHTQRYGTPHDERLLGLEITGIELFPADSTTA